MSTEIKPIKVWGVGGPNPPKVAMILEELSVPYETVPMQFANIKTPEYLAVNPNGRVPAIKDPNTDLTLWESGAILLYLINKYDTEHKISFAPETPESYHAQQWLFFQVSGQGPYYGQAAWFTMFHPEKLPSVIERYHKEINRVTSVLEGHLAKQKEAYPNGDGPWLVGNKFSYADISFVPWQLGVQRYVPLEDYNVDNYPHVKEWLEKMNTRESIKKPMAAAAAAMKH